MNPKDCNEDRRALGLAYPRTCSVCGLGPCRKRALPAQPVSVEEVAILEADLIALIQPVALAGISYGLDAGPNPANAARDAARAILSRIQGGKS